MIFTGVLYQYDQESGTGLLMVGNGEKKEFEKSQWADSENEPAMGQRISYEVIGEVVQVKLVTEEAIQRANAYKEQMKEEGQNKPQETSPNCSIQFQDIDTCIQHYTNLGFKCIRDTQEGLSRVLSFRYYSSASGDFAEAIIKQTGDTISVTQTLNGQTVTVG